MARSTAGLMLVLAALLGTSVGIRAQLRANHGIDLAASGGSITLLLPRRRVGAHSDTTIRCVDLTSSMTK